MRDGHFLALRLSTIANLGAYLGPRGVIPLISGTKLLASVYRMPAVYYELKAVFTNTVPTCPYRGAGHPEVIFQIERLVDTAARELGIDPAELRRRNLIPQGDAAPDGRRRHLRLRRLRAQHGRRAAAGGLERLCRAPQGRRAARRAYAVSASRIASRPAVSARDRRPGSMSMPTVSSPCAWAPNRAGKATPRSTARSWPSMLGIPLHEMQRDPGRHRHRAGRRRHRRLPLARDRRLRARAHHARADRKGETDRGRQPGSGRRRHRIFERRISSSSAPTGRSAFAKSRARCERACRSPRSKRSARPTQHLSERLPYLRGRGRSRHRRDGNRRLHDGP